MSEPTFEEILNNIKESMGGIDIFCPFCKGVDVSWLCQSLAFDTKQKCLVDNYTFICHSCGKDYIVVSKPLKHFQDENGNSKL